MSPQKTQFDFIIIGTGIAGLNCAIQASKKGRVLVITKKKMMETTTNYAQGGIAGVIDDIDDFEKHINDTLIAGAHHNNKAAVKYMVKHGPEEIEKLRGFGVPFASKDGNLVLTREGGHSEKRIAYVGDHTGHSIEKSLIKKKENTSNINVWQDTFVTDLLVKNNVCYGVRILKNRKTKDVFASSVILACGGLGQVYKYTTNPAISTGDGIAMAYRAGAETKDLEFIQFHPTALNLPRKKKFLLSEAMRGEGAYLRNHKKKRFMQDYDDRKELAPRDIVSRSVYNEEKKGPVYLDITHKSPAFIKKRFPKIYKRLKKIGIDITKHLIPISPAAHYCCGGVNVNLKGETSIKNLYACGETARSGVHGANRLASNSLLEAIVYSSRIADELKPGKINKFPKFPKIKSRSSTSTEYLKKKIREIMWNSAGIERNPIKLNEALKKLLIIQKEFKPGNTINDHETQNIIDCSVLIVKAALKRKKSLGCHWLGL